MQTIEIAQGSATLNKRAVIDATALNAALAALLLSKGRMLADWKYEIVPTTGPEDVPAIMVRSPVFAFIAHGELVDALKKAMADAEAEQNKILNRLASPFRKLFK
jgi:hypothetical protein